MNAKTGSVAAALGGCTVPAVGAPTFLLGEGEIELGVGIHGEAGRECITMKTTAELAEIFLNAILHRIQPRRSQPLLLMCNGLGVTPPIELYSFYHAARQHLDRLCYRVERGRCRQLLHRPRHTGASLTGLDEKTLPLWDAPATTAAFRCN
ncbi:dihydroxyacetone kinase subunit DhaK [Ensifer sp. 4252]|uniref:dihydroxyacetone kinase subunit DhaK n=1 Tax=Ensifer sp. 4252 TaxID=3373915 RepID=UPI003D1E62E2